MASRNTTLPPNRDHTMTVDQLRHELKDVPGFYRVVLVAPTFDITDGETLESYDEASCEDVILINEDDHEVELFGMING